MPAALRASQPPGEVLLANRGHLLSQLTFPSENHHRAGHTGRLRGATLADMGCCRMPFPIRDARVTRVGRPCTQHPPPSESLTQSGGGPSVALGWAKVPSLTGWTLRPQ